MARRGERTRSQTATGPSLWRTIIAAVVVCALVGVFIVRLADIQVVQADELGQQVGVGPV